MSSLEIEKKIIYATNYNCTVCLENTNDFYISSHFYDAYDAEIQDGTYKYVNREKMMENINAYLRKHGKKLCLICDKNYSDMKCISCQGSFCYDCFIKNHYEKNKCYNCNKKLDLVFDYFEENKKKIKKIL